jgi:site-specific DNA-cytosine methylase
LTNLGFETSEARDLLTTTLRQIGFIFQEFLINPTEIGIPNSRLRYYLIGKRQTEKFAFETRDEIYTTLNFQFCDELAKRFELDTKKCLSDYLSELSTEEEAIFSLQDRTLEKVFINEFNHLTFHINIQLNFHPTTLIFLVRHDSGYCSAGLFQLVLLHQGVHKVRRGNR